MSHCRRQILSAFVLCLSAALSAATPDLTSSLEFIANPQMERWPNNAGARGCLDLQFYQGRLFNGGGEVESNPGAPWLQSINPYDLSYQFEYAPGTEAIANYLVTSWGDLVTPSQDPHEGDANIGHVFSRTPEGAWSRFSSVGGSLPAGSTKVSNNTHCWHMAEFDDRVFVACYNLLSSTNRFKTFEVCSPITSAYHSISYSYGFEKFFSMKIYQYSTIDTLRRQVHLMQFGDRDLFAIGNTVVNPALWTNKNVNNQELYWYNRTTKQFEERSQHLSTIYPNLTTNDYRLVGRNLKLLATNECAYVWMRAWHPTTFKDRVLYIASYDTPPYGSKVSPFEDTIAWTSYPLPLMGCSATVSTDHKISATRLNFGGDTENYPWDFAVAGDTVYTFTTKYNATTKLNRHIVWKSTDGVNFSEVLAFDFHQNMISLEYRDGWFYFGCGYKKATLGYSYDGTADESGAIYRVRCPQEPVEVIPSVGELTIAEGRSAQVSFRLSAAPATNLTLRVGATRDNTRFTTDKSSLTFTTTNWSTPQTVTITLQDNDVIDVNRTGVVACGVAGFDVERGEFCGAEATSGSINLTADDDEITPPANGEIRTADDFYCAMSFPDGSYKLMNDIDLSGSLYTTIDEFSGSLDGNGHTIKGFGEGPFCKVSRGVLSNLTIDGTGTVAKVVGSAVLCNEIAGGAFTNVAMKGYTVQASAPDTYFGLFAAQITGKCEFVNCTIADDCKLSQAGNHDCIFGTFAAKLTVANSSGVLARFLNCTNNAVIASSDNYRTGSGAGGFLGVISGCASSSVPEIIFENCANNGALTGSGRNNAIGGFVARHNASNSKTASSVTRFIKCVNNGPITTAYQNTPTGVAAGFVAHVGTRNGGAAANATFDQCCNRAEIKGGTFEIAAGLVGYFGDYATNVGDGGMRFVNCANYGDMSSTNVAAGIVGYVSANTGYANGKFIFLNSANYGALESYNATNGQIVAYVYCNATSDNTIIAISNCWTKTESLSYYTAKEPAVGGNQNSSMPTSYTMAMLNNVASANDEYLAWDVGPTGHPELTEGEAGEAPDPTEPVEFIATFDFGFDGLSTNVVVNGYVAPAIPAIPEREGFDFVEWQPAVGVMGSNTTFVAKWSRKPVAPSARNEFSRYMQLTLGRDLHASSPVAGVPALVRLSEGINGFRYSQFTLANGGDLMFTDAYGNPIPHEVDTWNPGGESLVWVRLPSSAANTAIWMLWGRGGTPDKEAKEVWEGYKGVWHFGDAVADSAYGTYRNSANGGVKYNGLLAQQSTSNEVGSVGKCFRVNAATYNASDSTKAHNYGGVFVPDPDSDLIDATFTISGWFKHNSEKYYYDHYFYKKSSLNATGGGFAIENRDGNASTRKVGPTGEGSTGNSGTYVLPACNANWSHVTFVYSNTTCTVYADGAQVGVVTVGAVTSSGSLPLGIGNNPKVVGSDGLADDVGDAAWCGWIDEVRLADATPDANAIAAEYNAMNRGDTDIFQFSSVTVIDGEDPEVPPQVPTYELTVLGDPANLGAPSPAYGTHTVTQGQTVAVSVSDSFLNDAQTSKAVCLAWAAIADGDPIAYALSGTGSFVMPAKNVTLAFNFAVSNLVSATASAHGSVSSAAGWYATNDTVTVTATADDGYEFAGWTGDVTDLDATSDELSFKADAPRSLVANFSRVIQPGEETAIFVAVDGNDNGAGTLADPLLTLSNAVARLGDAGGKIIMGAGVFTSLDPVVVTSPVEIIGAGCGEDGTILRNVGTYDYNTHAVSRVLEISNAVARVQGLVVENGFVGIGSGNNFGGGICLIEGAVSNCVIRGCGARQSSGAMPYGGGVYVGGTDALLTHCVVSNCTSVFDQKWGSSVCGAGVHVANGGRVANTLVVNCRSGSATPGYALIVGGIMLTEGSAENCTVVGCWGSRAGGIAAIPASKKTVSVVNCVAFGCEQRIKDADGVLQTTASNGDGTESCFTACAFDVTAAAFADYAHGDYTPAAGGALVDAGGSVVAPATDLAGNPRVYGVAIDIGCYEAQGGAPAPDAVDLTDDETHAGAVSVPYAWLTEKGFDCSTPERAKAAATQKGANGYTVWESYVADLVPSDPASKLTATITVGADGEVSVDCTPKSAARVYRVLGKANLTDAEWTEKADGHRFFKIEVNLP